MNIFPDDEFLMWYLIFMDGDVLTCPHCNEEIFRGALEEAFDGAIIVCPHCGANITEVDFTEGVEEEKAEEEKKEKEGNNEYYKYEEMKNPLPENISLSDVLSRELIVVDFKAKDKDDTIRKIAKLFFEKNKVETEEQVYANLLKRESLGSTGIGRGVALPYAVSDAKEDLITAVLISKEGIDFGSLDGKPTHVFVSITGRRPSQRDTGIYLKYLAHISRLFDNDEIVPKLKKVENVDGVFDVIKDFEEKLKTESKGKGKKKRRKKNKYERK